METLTIAKDYSKFPGGRYSEDGEGNATDFRENYLVPMLEKNAPFILDLNGVVYYPISFIDEVFGGLVRMKRYSEEQLIDLIKFKATDSNLFRTVENILEHIKSPDQETWLN